MGRWDLGIRCTLLSTVVCRRVQRGLFGSFPERPWRWSGTSGLRDVQASALLASREIASRLARQRIPKRRPLGRPGTVARFLRLPDCSRRSSLKAGSEEKLHKILSAQAVMSRDLTDDR
jgi:hypothetical protein